MKLSYGADAEKIDLELIKTESMTRRVVVDQHQSYLYTAVTITCQCIYQPKATSYRRQGQTIQKQVNQLPALTETALRHKLMQPRKQLVYQDEHANIVIRCPEDGKIVDAANGPLPEVHHVNAIHGTRAWRVTVSFTCHLNECDLFTNSPPTMLSHEWKMQHFYDERYFQTVAVTGRCIFNTARLGDNVPDNFRQWLFLAVGQNFKRQDVQVIAEESGRELRYSYTDMQQRLSIRRADIPRIECSHSGHIESAARVSGLTQATATTMSTLQKIGQALGSIATSGASGVASSQAAIASGAAPRANTNLGTHAEGAARAGQTAQTLNSAMPGGDIFTGTVGLMGRLVPHRRKTCRVVVYGNPRSPLATLQGAGWGVVAYRLGHDVLSNDVRNIFNTDVSEHHDVTNGIVEIVASIITSVEYQAMELFNEVFVNGNTETFLVAPVDDLTPEIAKFHPSPGAAVPGSTTLPVDHGTRGYDLAAAVAQQLQGDCEKPKKPARKVRVTTLDPHQP